MNHSYRSGTKNKNETPVTPVTPDFRSLVLTPVTPTPGVSFFFFDSENRESPESRESLRDFGTLTPSDRTLTGRLPIRVRKKYHHSSSTKGQQSLDYPVDLLFDFEYYEREYSD